MSEDFKLNAFFIPCGNAPLQWYRMIQPARFMGSFDDVAVMYPKFNPRHKGVPEYETNLEKYLTEFDVIIRMSDIVVIQQVHTTKMECLAKAIQHVHHKPVLMEMDDHPFSVDPDNPSYHYAGPDSRIETDIYNQMKEADGVVVSTDYLKNSVVSSVNENVHVVPNAIDLSLWDAPERQNNGSRVIIGWSGGSAHLRNVSLVKKALEHVLKERENVVVRMVHGIMDPKWIDHPRFEISTKFASIEDYPKRLLSENLDIGLAPLWDSEFNRAKSNLRYLEYSAMGIPTIASNVEPYRKSITHGIDGFFANTTREWVDKILFLVDNEDVRREIGKRAYDHVKRAYSARETARKYADLLKRIVQQRAKNVQLLATSGSGSS